MELGSEFNLDLADLKISPDNIWTYLEDYTSVLGFDSGRSAIKHISVSLKPASSVMLPEFICESVIRSFDGHPITFYRLNTDFTVDTEDLSKKITSGCAVFLMHYFGAVQPSSILQRVLDLCAARNCLIIEDTTHSIISKPSTIGDYQVCSIRKWLPIPGGGVLYSKEDRLGIMKASHPVSENNERTYGMILKDLFLKGKLDCNQEYRGIFAFCEEQLDRQEEIYQISDLARFISSCFSVNEIRKRRITNYRILQSKLKEPGIFPALSLSDDQCPLSLPIHVSERDKLRQHLMENRIYCAVHWPFDGHCLEDRPFARKSI